MKPANKRFWIVIGIIVALLLGWWAWSYFSPKPLGDKMEYLGQESYGSWFFLSDAKPGSNYYYATNLSLEEVVAYFKKSSVEQKPTLTNGEAYFSIKTASGEVVYLNYYQHPNLILHQHNFPSIPNKPFVLTFTSTKYDALKSSVNETRE